MDAGTAIVLCVLIACLMAPVVIDSLGDAGAFQRGVDHKRGKEKEK